MNQITVTMVTNKFLLLLILFVSLNSNKLFSQSSSTSLEPINLEENWTNNRPINGEKRVGILSYTKLKFINPEYLTVLIPDSESDFLCLSIVSLDGRYSAKLNYDISKEAPGLIKLHFPTKHKSKLRKYSPEEITVLASIGSNCNTSSNSFVLTTWDKDVSEDFFIVYINTRNQASIIAFENNEIEFEKDFSKIESDNYLKVAYNQSCKIPMKYIDSKIKLFIRERKRSFKIDIELPIKK
ncbi:hypothetical protein [Psychroserpens sp. SPM9]|uniref:hypothetical protein n=1 Tax=Psychroserpens sp. SPM9 TaxID=2975598 RepID=UPI0021A81B86|nr:hypothetical protein [Psychroserpens sp. SPM9]MDG5491195.1 hypothetical protein [Psychroserpens sp. SPM9]